VLSAEEREVYRDIYRTKIPFLWVCVLVVGDWKEVKTDLAFQKVELGFLFERFEFEFGWESCVLDKLYGAGWWRGKRMSPELASRKLYLFKKGK